MKPTGITILNKTHDDSVYKDTSAINKDYTIHNIKGYNKCAVVVSNPEEGQTLAVFFRTKLGWGLVLEYTFLSTEPTIVPVEFAGISQSVAVQTGSHSTPCDVEIILATG